MKDDVFNQAISRGGLIIYKFPSLPNLPKVVLVIQVFIQTVGMSENLKRLKVTADYYCTLGPSKNKFQIVPGYRQFRSIACRGPMV